MSGGALMLGAAGLIASGTVVGVVSVLAREHARTAQRYREACQAAQAQLAHCSPEASTVAGWISAAGEDRAVATVGELVGIVRVIRSRERDPIRVMLALHTVPQPVPHDRRMHRQRGCIRLSLAQNLALVLGGGLTALCLVLLDPGPGALQAEQAVQDEVLALQAAHAAAAVGTSAAARFETGPEGSGPVESAVVAVLQPLALPRAVALPVPVSLPVSGTVR